MASARIFAFLFLGTFLLQLPPSQEFLRLPLLWEHFQEHQLEHPGLSFAEFLSLHYNTGINHHHEAHDQLPFKSITFSMLSLSLIDWGMPFVLRQPDCISSQPLASWLIEGQTFHRPSGVWQPPRIS